MPRGAALEVAGGVTWGGGGGGGGGGEGVGGDTGGRRDERCEVPLLVAPEAPEAPEVPEALPEALGLKRSDIVRGLAAALFLFIGILDL